MLSAVRVYEEVQAAGYEGRYTQVKEYVRQVRPSTHEAVVRFETAVIPSCPKTQTNSRLARRAVSIVIDPWRTRRVQKHKRT